MQMYKPKFKENDTAIYETLNRQFLDSFKDRPVNKPRKAKDTCDLHLKQQQPFKFVDPKGNWVNEITWNEPKDIREFWLNQEKRLWGIIALSSFIFLIAVYYYWGLAFV